MMLSTGRREQTHSKEGQMYYSAKYRSPIGLITLVSDDTDNIVAVWMEGQKYYGDSVRGEIIEQENVPALRKASKWLDRYFAGERPDIDELLLAPNGGEFRQQVWEILRNIPYGEVVTYGDIAKEIAKKQGKKEMSAQAVGGAVGHNPISIIVPCHRVVGSNKSLTGFSGGISKKMKLLQHEGVDISELAIPTKGTAL